jgi:hypothetical protein
MAAPSRYNRDYYCTKCGQKTDRDKLTPKKAVFTGMGAKAKTHRSRVMAHLCPACLAKDPDWNREPYAEPEFEVLPEHFRDEGDDNDPAELVAGNG